MKTKPGKTLRRITDNGDDTNRRSVGKFEERNNAQSNNVETVPMDNGGNILTDKSNS